MASFSMITVSLHKQSPLATSLHTMGDGELWRSRPAKIFRIHPVSMVFHRRCDPSVRANVGTLCLALGSLSLLGFIAGHRGRAQWRSGEKHVFKCMRRDRDVSSRGDGYHCCVQRWTHPTAQDVTTDCNRGIASEGYAADLAMWLFFHTVKDQIRVKIICCNAKSC